MERFRGEIHPVRTRQRAARSLVQNILGALAQGAKDCVRFSNQAGLQCRAPLRPRRPVREQAL